MKSKSSNKSRSRSLRAPSLALTDYLARKYRNQIPVPVLTAAHKLYGRNRPLHKDDRFISRFADSKTEVNGDKLVAYFSKNEAVEKGKPLGAPAVERVYLNYANHDGKLSFDYLMKMAEGSGAAVSERAAKAMVRRYGKGKDYLSLEDCQRVSARWSGGQAGRRSRAAR